MSFFFTPLVIGLMVFAKPLFVMLFTAKFAQAAEIFQVFVLCHYFICIPYDAVQRATGRGRWLLTNSLVFSLIALVLCGAGFWLFGMWGALLGMLATRILNKLNAIYYVRTHTNWSITDFLPLVPMIRYLFISILLAVVALTIRPLFSSEIVWMITAGPLCGLAYFTVAALSGEMSVITRFRARLAKSI